MFKLLWKRRRLLIIWGVVLGVVFAGLSLFLPRQYSADSQVLILSRDRLGVDPYTQAKSAERLGENLAQVMKTSDFFNKVMNTKSYLFDKSQWTDLSERNKRKKWTKDVVASMVYGTGLMNIRAYSYNPEEAKNLSNAVTQIAAAQGWEYLGNDVAIKVVSSPLSSRFPARPNVIVNILAGLILGMLIGSYWIIKYSKHLFS